MIGVSEFVYRSMSNEEADATLSRQRPVFQDRFKWFGTPGYVRSTVMDGRFNGSRKEPWKYRRLLRFEVLSGMEWMWRKREEFRLDIGKIGKVEFGRIEDVTFEEME